ncbi:dihydrodipicolinate synthase family protein, partial [Escherichia coli]|uniref:dihydrodipicolinate synthase family protein n=1 Tax=Escherichia coli TaxID=562 RepID=UPI00193A6998
EISTRESINLGHQNKILGIDGVSVIVPYFVPLNQEELIANYSAMAGLLSMPNSQSNMPTRLNHRVQPLTGRALTTFPNINGIK